MRQYGEVPEDEGRAVERDAFVARNQNAKAPTAAEVSLLHRNSDVDARPESQHHTLGSGPNNAAPGDHNHRDGKSAPLLEGVQLTGSKGGNVAIGSIVAALVQLGATDNTT